jgi:hypothetical protein
VPWRDGSLERLAINRHDRQAECTVEMHAVCLDDPAHQGGVKHLGRVFAVDHPLQREADCHGCSGAGFTFDVQGVTVKLDNPIKLLLTRIAPIPKMIVRAIIKEKPLAKISFVVSRVSSDFPLKRYNRLVGPGMCSPPIPPHPTARQRNRVKLKLPSKNSSSCPRTLIITDHCSPASYPPSSETRSLFPRYASTFHRFRRKFFGAVGALHLVLIVVHPSPEETSSILRAQTSSSTSEAPPTSLATRSKAMRRDAKRRLAGTWSSAPRRCRILRTGTRMPTRNTSFP